MHSAYCRSLGTWYLNVYCVRYTVHLNLCVCVLHMYACARLYGCLLEFVCKEYGCHSADTHKHVLFKIIRTQYLLGWLFHRRHPFHGYLNSIRLQLSLSLPFQFPLTLRRIWPSSESKCVFSRLLCFILSHVITTRTFYGWHICHIQFISNECEPNIQNGIIDRGKAVKKNNLQITIITVIIIRTKEE